MMLFSHKNFKMEFQKLSRGNIFLISDINQNFQKLNSDFSESEFWNLKQNFTLKIFIEKNYSLMFIIYIFKTSISDATAKLASEISDFFV